jgi:hypothetical protein
MSGSALAEALFPCNRYPNAANNFGSTMLRVLTSFFAMIAVFSAAPSQAQVGLVTIGEWQHGAWMTGLKHPLHSSRKFCTAETQSVAGQTFRVVLYEDADAFVEIIDESLEFKDGDPVEIALRIDNQVEHISGQGWSNAVSWDLIDPIHTAELFVALSAGTRLEVMLFANVTIARFSLRGSRDALAGAQDCWNSLRSGELYTPR